MIPKIPKPVSLEELTRLINDRLERIEAEGLSPFSANGDIDMNGFRLVNVGAPKSSTDAGRLAEVAHTRYTPATDTSVGASGGPSTGGGGGEVLDPPGVPKSVALAVGEYGNNYRITVTWVPPSPIGTVTRYEAQFKFYLDSACATPEDTSGAWSGQSGVTGASATTLTTDLWPKASGQRWVRTRVHAVNADDTVSAWVESPVGTGPLINAAGSGTAGAIPDNVAITSAGYEYADEVTLSVWIYFTLPTNATGAHVWEEVEDQSTSGGSPMDGTAPLNGTRNLGGVFSPIDHGYFSKSPVSLLLPRPDGPVVKRFYLASFNADMEQVLVRATDPNPTPSVKLNITAPIYQSGVEYAQLITGPTATPQYDDSQVSSPKYRLTFTWIAPTDPPAVWQRPFGGVQIVYEYGDGSRANGPSFAVNEINAKSDWYDLFVGTSAIKCWFVSYDASETPRLNTIIAGVTPFATATVTWPLSTRPPAAIYADNVTAFLVSNARYDINGAGQKVLRIDATWTQPAAGAARARWGGLIVWIHLPGGGKVQVSGAEPGAGLTMEFYAFPVAVETWVFYGVSIDNNNNPNTDGRNPIAGTPTSSIAVGPPGGGVGTEFTSNVTGQGFSVASVAASDGTTQQRISATFTKPNDVTWGGVEMRVYDDLGVLMGVVVSSVSPVKIDLPNPAYAMSATVKLVSFDVNNKNNSEQANTPQGTVLIGSATGTLDLGKFLPSSSDFFAVDANGKIIIKAQAITVTEIKDNSISTPKLQANAVVANIIAADAVVAGKVAANAIASREIIAGSINSDRLNATAINVGGGGSKPGKFAVFDGGGSQIGFIGVEGGNIGAWFRTIAIGSTSYANAPLKADNSGNITLDFPAANSSVNRILISQTSYAPTYNTAGIQICNGSSPTTGSDTTWYLSRGMVLYGTSLTFYGEYKCLSCNRDPNYGNAGEVVVTGPSSVSYIRLGGDFGRVRADGGYQVSSNVGVTGSYVFGTRTVTITGGIITAVT